MIESPDQAPFAAGIIEGFFGRPWSFATRKAYASFLRKAGLDRYIYAPKDDAWLRKKWDQPFPAAHAAELQSLGAHLRQEGVRFGIGLSPFELYRDFSARGQSKLLAKIEAINTIGPQILCILFDDMSGDLDGLARQQVAIMDFVQQHSSAEEFLLCPTYYSSDPRLEKLFGSSPHNYLEELGARLAPDIGIFWTGPQIISSSYPREHLAELAERLQRKPVLWDNYPVNDAERLCHILHLKPAERSAELCSSSAGLYANPMNQAWLSQLPLYALAQQLRGASTDKEALFLEACTALCPPPLAAALQEDAALFQEQGLQQITAPAKAVLLDKYRALQPAPMAQEVIDWLQGKYLFDPSCLS